MVMAAEGISMTRIFSVPQHLIFSGVDDKTIVASFLDAMKSKKEESEERINASRNMIVEENTGKRIF